VIKRKNKFEIFFFGKNDKKKFKQRSLIFGHKKIILYASPGKEGFYKKLGFKQMNTAMAIFSNEQRAIEVGLLSST
jgi:hypothetical protein